MLLFSTPLFPSTLVIGAERSIAVVTPSPLMGQGCIGGLGSSRQDKLVEHPLGTIWWRLCFRVLGTANWKRAAGGEREEEAEGGGGSDLASRREVVPSSLRQSGGGRSHRRRERLVAGSEFVSSNPLSFFRKYQDSRNRKWSHCLHQCLGKGGGGGVPC